MKYNPLKAPDPEEWLEMGEGERILLVKEYHKRAKIRLPNAQLHAGLHATVENQVAMKDVIPVAKALERLMSEGLDRHEAVHALAMANVEVIHDAISKKTGADLSEEFFKRVRRLTAKKWLSSFLPNGPRA